MLYNHAFRRVRQGSEAHFVMVDLMFKLFELNQHRIHPHQLKNVVALLAHNGKLGKAQEVLDRFENRIQGDHGEDALKYNQAVLLFHRGHPISAFRLFKEVMYAPNGQYFKLDGRLYLWRCQVLRSLQGRGYDDHWYNFEKEKSRQFFRRFAYRSLESRTFYLTYFQVFRKLYFACGEVVGKKRQDILQEILVEVSQFKAHPLRKWTVETVGAALREKGRVRSEI